MKKSIEIEFTSNTSALLNGEEITGENKMDVLAKISTSLLMDGVPLKVVLSMADDVIENIKMQEHFESIESIFEDFKEFMEFKKAKESQNSSPKQ